MATHEDIIEGLRWKLHRYTVTTPEQFEEHRKEPWLGTGRNHSTWTVTKNRGRGTPAPGTVCLQREEREEGYQGRISINDGDNEALAQLVLGRTITAIHREPCSGQEWEQGANAVTMTLDDGAQLHFGSIGYDSDACLTDYVPASALATANPV